ncbi:unnamed protein product [Urochloa humidicola]
MEDLVVGISKAAVEALVNKVKSAIKEEAELWQIVQRDIVFIKDEFEMMQSFLNTADGERVKNNVVRTWVRQVRDLSYDAEDCIESVLHLDMKQSFWTLGIRLLASCKSGATLPLDEAVAEIRLLKARVEEVSQRNMRYNLISDSGSKPIVQQQMPSSFAVGVTAVDTLSEARDTARKRRGSVDLSMLLTERNNDLQVISVWGTGGDLGMTSIIKEAYDKPEICKNFRCRAWLKLTHPFSPHEFIRNLAAQFYGNSCGEQAGEIKGLDVLARMDVTTQGADLICDFLRHVNKQTYLVILEDLCSMAEWHAVRTYLPDSTSGSRIVVSTQHQEIASLCTGQPYQVSELKKLSDTHSVCVFFKEGLQRAYVGGTDSVKGTAFVGRNSEVNRLLNMITLRNHDAKHHVVSVWGTAGIGKSVVVETIIPKVRNVSAFDKFGRVHVSHPFNLWAFSRRLLSDMRPGGHVRYLIEECYKLLHNNRCFVVIDGLQSKEHWDLIKSKVIRSPSQSCILVVTREESLATHCVATDNNAVCSLKGLEADEGLDLFTKVFHEVAGTDMDEDMIEDAKDILDKCGGIPKVIIALANYLATRSEATRMREMNRLKANFVPELETNPDFASLRDLFAWMHSYFDAFPRSLKLCMMYLSVFPQDKIVRRSRLVRRCIAENYCKCTDSKTMEEYAVEHFDRLGPQTATIAERQLNTFFREYINSRLMEEKVFFPLQVSVLDKDHGNLTTEHLGQHLAIRSCWKGDEYVFDNLDLSQIQSLTVFGEWREYFIPYKMRSLRVLDLEDASKVTGDHLEQIVDRLPRLRFLSIRGCSQISYLPDSMGGLRQLQTMDIRDTSITMIPKCIIKLEKLQCICAGTTVLSMDPVPAPTPTPRRWLRTSSMSCLPGFPGHHTFRSCNGVKVPRGIGQMTALHKLGIVDADAAGGKAFLKELKNLVHLRKLGVSGIHLKNSKQFCFAISGHIHLESLSVQVKERIGPINFPFNLMKLSLEIPACWLQQEYMEAIGKLEKLQTLSLRVSDTYGQVKFPMSSDDTGSSLADPFSQLKVLKIACRHSLHVTFDTSVMERLELLKADCRYGPSEIRLYGLVHLSSLKQVWVKGRCEEILRNDLQDQLADHPNKPLLKFEPENE